VRLRQLQEVPQGHAQAGVDFAIQFRPKLTYEI
jgi:hypothetical protein